MTRPSLTFCQLRILQFLEICSAPISAAASSDAQVLIDLGLVEFNGVYHWITSAGLAVLSLELNHA